MSLDDNQQIQLRNELIQKAGRSLFLVPTDRAKDEIVAQVTKDLGYATFSANDIEASKQAFISAPKAVAVVANRYDGIDFPGDECRLLFVDGLPKAMNSQERFLMSRMGANALFNERVQTRVLQAIGRCTRSPEDFSAIVLTGDEIPEYLADTERRRHFHPELQAELAFGIEQSRSASVADLVDNFRIFSKNDMEWESQGNNRILAMRNQLSRIPMPAMSDLAAVAPLEIDYQQYMWQGDFEGALGVAESVLGRISATELQGYRALWHYLAGSAAWLCAQGGASHLKNKSAQHYSQAKTAATGIPWLVSLAKFNESSSASERETNSAHIMSQLERVESLLVKLGTVHTRNFDLHERKILEGLADENQTAFEEAHRLLGELLGFEAGNDNSSGAPDPWWIAPNACFVFEDHAGAKPSGTLGTSSFA